MVHLEQCFYTSKVLLNNNCFSFRIIPLSRPGGSPSPIQLDNKVPSSVNMEGSDEQRSVKYKSLAGVLDHTNSNHSYENVSI